MTRYLEYRAGRRALRRIREQGFAPEAVRTLIAPAAGPRWLVAAGFDRALIEQLWLGRTGPTLLAGSSAGAWRCLAFASPEPARAHARLLEEYLAKVFTAEHTPEQIGASYRESLERVVPRAHAPHVLAHPALPLALCAARVKGWIGARGAAQKLALGAAAAAHALSARTRALFFESTLFVSAHAPSEWFTRSDSVRAELTADNLHDVALASGSVPMYMAPVAIAARGVRASYLDGGLTDYHVNQRLGDPMGLALLFSHDRRIIPSWFDKHLPWRVPSPHVLDDLLLVHPSPAFLRLLPDGRVPSRDDFMHFVRSPQERIRRWRAAVEQSDRLGEQLLDDVAHARVPELVQPL